MEYSDIGISYNNNNNSNNNFHDQDSSVDVSNSYSLHHHMKELSPPNKTGMYVSANNLSPGRMTLLMGSPGSGKSILLKTLANRSLGNCQIEGSLLFNNHPVDPSTHHKDTIYVPQEDRHIALLTVKETMDFSAQCNMGEYVDESIRNERVNLILDQLGITHTSNTIVGNEFFRGISGGQKRRMTIASEFTKNPNLILMDEPTTGLDSATSLSIISKVKQITTQSKTSTLISLLQPSNELTSLFDDVMIMTENGNISYFGSMRDILPYFRSIGMAPLIDQPVAEFFQDLTEEPVKYLIQKPSDGSSDEPKINLPQLYKQSQNYSEVLNTISNLIPRGEKLVDHSGNKERSSILYETKNLLIMGFIVGSLYYNLGDDQAGAENKLAVIYVAIYTQIWTALGAVEEFYTLRGIFYDQKEGKFYRTFPYFVSIVITKFPLGLFETILFTLPCYWLTGLRARADSFFLFIIGLTLMNWAALGTFQAVSSMTPSLLTAILLTPAVIILYLVFGGFMISNNNIPGWWIWIHYLSPIKYTLDMLCQNELYGVDLTCSPSELVPPSTISNFNSTYNGVQICPRTSGNDYLAMFGMRENYWFRWIDVVILLAFISFYFAIVYTGLKMFNFETVIPTTVLKAKKSKKIKAKLDKNKHIMGKCYVTIKNLSYTVNTTRKNVTTDKMEKVDLTLLKNINAYVKPGLMALMGASGAGKSTLLDVLSNRKTMGTVSGDISINGISTKGLNLNRFTGYVEQQDILPDNLTIREAIEFSANCRLPGSVTFEERTRLIDEILGLLNLVKIQHTAIGNPIQTVLNYFSKLGYHHDPKRNPADFILEISENFDPSKTSVSPLDAYRSSQEAAHTESLLNSNAIVPNGLTLPKFKGEYSSPFSTQFRCLLRRSWLNNVRRPSIIYMRIFRAIIPALVMGTLYLRLGQGQDDARNKLSCIYLGFFFCGMSSFGKLPTVFEDRGVYYREASSSTYSPLLYLISFFITDLPMSLITGFVYWIPFFFLTGLDLGDGGWKFFLSLLIYTLVTMCFDSLAILSSFFFPNLPIASIALGLLLSVLTTFGGFYIPYPSIPKGWRWFNYMMFTKYGFETLGITEMSDQKFNCDDGGAFQIPIGNGTIEEYCPIQTGEDMIAKYDFDTDRNYFNILILSAFILGHTFLSYISLKYIKHINK
eukprot:gene8337-10241_t